MTFDASEILEIIDKHRIPLAEKRLNGEELTVKESINLKILDSLTDNILSVMSYELDATKWFTARKS